MNKPHKCKVTTLKNQEWWKKLSDQHVNNKRKGMVFCSQNISNIQVYYEGKDYEIANQQRGGIAESNKTPKIFDIVYHADGNSKAQMVQNGCLSILKEKICNDLVVYEKLLEEMGIDAKITLEDVAEYLGA